MNHIQRSVTLPDGKVIHFETGRLAKQADGSVVVRCGDTMLLATVVANKEAKPGVDFLPLSVDYIEKYASSGKIPGGFFKREGRLGEHEILTSRLVDRALRPLFPEDYHCEVQMMIQLISADLVELPDALACFAASAALMTSDIPFQDPVSEVRVARVNGQFVINPTAEVLAQADMDLMVAGTNDSIVMVEGEMDEVTEEDFLAGMIEGHKAIKLLNDAQLELRAAVGKTMREYEKTTIEQELWDKMKELCWEKMNSISRSFKAKQERSEAFSTLYTETMEAILPHYESLREQAANALAEGVEGPVVPENLESKLDYIFTDLQWKAVRRMVLDDKVRLDGRKPDEVRPIWGEVSYLPRAHGSSIFTRGETQSLCTVTLGTKLDEQMIDTATSDGTKRFMLHYNFPPFSTGEVKRLGSPGRREVGHGNLAERALKKVMPADYEYVVRVVSDILESNGSSSMATVCGGCMALMDAGVTIKAPVSGIAMGLVTDMDGSGKYTVLSDILGDEDFLGDMDFKVTGTTKGLTACQMDMKVRGLSYEVLHNALQQSKAGRLHILDCMLQTISAVNPELSPYAPRIATVDIPQDMIGAVIGPGGKVIQEMQRVSKTTIAIEEVDGKGVATIYSVDKDGLDIATRMIKQIIAMPEVGEIYRAKVKSIKEFGAFVEFMPGKEGLLHISEISHQRLPSMEGVLNVGDEFDIKLIGVDEKTGKFRLSRKVLLPRPEGMEEETSGNGGGGQRRHGGGGHGGHNRPNHRK